MQDESTLEFGHFHDAISVKIISLKRRRGRRGQVRLELSDGSVLDLSPDVALRAGLAVGDALQASDVAALEREDAAWRCKESALRLLSFRPRSEREIRQRLGTRSFPSDLVDACVADLTRAGLLDDAAFARTLARDRVRGKPVGKIRLRAELRAKGVDAETVADAIDETYSGEGGGELDLARRAAAKFKRRAGEETAGARRRLYGFLARRGFPPDAIQVVIGEMLPEDE